VRAGIVRDPAAYRWSSYKANAYGEADQVIQQHERYLSLDSNEDGRRSYYRALFAVAFDEFALDAIRPKRV
jgi:putative transposase